VQFVQLPWDRLVYPPDFRVHLELLAWILAFLHRP